MKSVLLIGMGQFGQLLGEKLIGMGNEVMIVDKEEDIINTIAAKYTGALICNCMVEDNLKTLDVPSYDACVVTIADDFQSSLEITIWEQNTSFQKQTPTFNANFFCA